MPPITRKQRTTAGGAPGKGISGGKRAGKTAGFSSPKALHRPSAVVSHPKASPTAKASTKIKIGHGPHPVITPGRG